MNQFEVLIPRSVQAIEWETIIVNAETQEEAIDNAIAYKNVVSSSYYNDNFETIDRHDDLIEVYQVKETA